MESRIYAEKTVGLNGFLSLSRSHYIHTTTSVTSEERMTICCFDVWITMRSGKKARQCFPLGCKNMICSAILDAVDRSSTAFVTGAVFPFAPGRCSRRTSTKQSMTFVTTSLSFSGTAASTSISFRPAEACVANETISSGIFITCCFNLTRLWRIQNSNSSFFNTTWNESDVMRIQATLFK